MAIRISRETIRIETGLWHRVERWAKAYADTRQEKKKLRAIGFEYSPRSGRYVKLLWRKEI
jgi:hypothetical protein